MRCSAGYTMRTRAESGLRLEDRDIGKVCRISPDIRQYEGINNCLKAKSTLLLLNWSSGAVCAKGRSTMHITQFQFTNDWLLISNIKAKNAHLRIPQTSRNHLIGMQLHACKVNV